MYQNNQVVGAQNVLLGESVGTLPNDELLSLLSVVRSSDMAIAVMGVDQNIKAVVRERLPDSRLPVRSLGLVGSATRAGRYLVRFNTRSFDMETQRKLLERRNLQDDEDKTP